ncbi:DUF6580 family putative transport protein [Pedobacter psychroterrae]|nr:DUF6580 family putative transport protein [Pedobacter psychroterrae]
MSDIKFNPRILVVLLIIVFISVIRIVMPYSDNFDSIAGFSAVGAIALFGGAYFNTNFKAFGFPLAILLLSDIFIAQTSGYGFFYAGWYWTYIAFILMVFAAKFLLAKINVLNFVTSVIAIVLIHWIVSDISAMYIPGLYEPTLAGYWKCLVAAIPFELKFLYGTVIYGGVMFGAFELLKVKYPALSLVRVTAR